VKQNSDIAPRRREGRGVKSSRFKKFADLCELGASAVNTSSQKTRNNHLSKTAIQHFAG
jgi:hypothetical protein